VDPPEAGGARTWHPTKEAGSMLTVTPTAAEVVRALVADAPIDDERGGIRISPAAQTPEGTSLQLTLVDAPEMADEEIDAGGAHVFLEPKVAEFLDDKVLDASIEPGGEVQFAVLEQPGFEPSPNGAPPV
jgi:iron-sulfur cluster assembly protein